MAPAPTLDAFLHGDEDGHDQDAESHMMRDPGVRTLHEAMTSLNPDFHSPRRADSDTMSPENQPGGNGGGGGNTSSPPAATGAAARKNSGAAGPGAPAWTELKTKAGKDRKRLPLACIACRRKKIRCSGEKPACLHCVHSRIPCVYKVTTRKPAPRTDYMAMLDKRLKRMEERVIRIIPKENLGIVAITGRAAVKPNLSGNGKAGAGAAIKKRSAESAFGEELEAWAAEGQTTEEAATDSSEPPPADHDKKRQQKHSGEEHDLLHDGTEHLPSRELQEHLAEVFFDYVYGQSYHLLHKPSFMRKLAQGTVPPVLMLAVCAVSARFSNHPAVLGRLRVSSEDRTQAPQQQQPAFLRGEQWARPAREISLRRYDQPSLTILTVYLLLGLHEFGTCQGGRSWMLGGMAQRMAYALQLHKDLDRDPRDRDNRDGEESGDGEGESSQRTFNPTEREIRRRTMWACFLMDRFNSSGTERPIFVGKQYIRAQLPIKEEYFLMELTGPTESLNNKVPRTLQISTNTEEKNKNNSGGGGDALSDPRANMGVAAYLIRTVALWGALINYLNLGGQEDDPHEIWHEMSKFQEIRRGVDHWTSTLPADLRYTTENLHVHASQKLANQFVFLHMVYNQVLLFMNRFALHPQSSASTRSTTMPDSFRAKSAAIALSAADQIAQLSREALAHNVVAPFAGYAAFCSSTVHIPLALATTKGNSSAQAARSKQCLSWNVRYLTQMKRYWGMFYFVSENLREVYRRSVAEAGRAAGVSGVQATGAAAAPQRADGSTPMSASGSESAATAQRGPELLQYGDWFERYPHGVAPGSNGDEPATPAKAPIADGNLVQDSGLQTLDEFFLTEQQKQRQQRILVARQRQQQQQQQQKGATARKRAASKPESTMKAEAAKTVMAGRASESPTLVAARGRSGKGGDGVAKPSQQQQQRQAGGTVVHDLSSIRAFQSRTSQPTLSRSSTLEESVRPQASVIQQQHQQRPQTSHPAMAVGEPTTLPTHALSARANNLLGSPFSGLGSLNDLPITNRNAGIPPDILQDQQIDNSNLYAQFDAASVAAYSAGTGTVDPAPTNGNDFWGDPSTAWFMPFNLEPPDDMSLFGNGGGAGGTVGPGAPGAGGTAFGSSGAFGGYSGGDDSAMFEWSAAFDGGFAGVPGGVFWSPEGPGEAMAVDLDAGGMGVEGMDQTQG